MAFVVALGLIVASGPALAQSTGGSFGGGSFGGGGGSYSGGGGSFGGGSSSWGGSSSSWGGSGSSYGSSGVSYSGGGGGFPWGFVISLVVFALVFIVKNAARGGFNSYGTNIGPPSHGAASWKNIDVSAIRIGIDWRARRVIQEALTRLAQSGDTSSKAGLARLLRETIVALQRTEIGWLYAHVSNYKPMSASAAEGIFRQLGMDARARFREELVRNADGSTSGREASAIEAQSHEGEGVVVVTVIVAAHREIVDVDDIHDANEIKLLLGSMSGVAHSTTLAAIEVIWSPAAENDRMSTAELEQFYPEMEKIDETSIAGRIFCGYCNGPYAMELLTCPHCGAPAPTPEGSAPT